MAKYKKGDRVFFSHFSESDTIDRVRSDGTYHLNGYGSNEWVQEGTLRKRRK